MRYYLRELKCETKKKGDVIYNTYYHNSVFAERKCGQRPKSFNSNRLNDIFKLFFFYFYLVFDNTNDLIKESQRNIKQKQLKLKEKIEKIEKEISVIDKRIMRFQNKLDNSTLEDDLLEILLRNIKSSEDKNKDLNIELSKIRIDYELQNEKFNKTLLEMTYYDVKERINNWFFKLNIEERRNELIKIIKSCKIFNHHIIIDTGKIVFLFDIKERYEFDMKLLENLNKDEIYKTHFIGLKNKREARRLNNRLIHNIDLNRDKEIKTRVFQYLIKTYDIIYNLNDKDKLISFISLSGIMGFELEYFNETTAGENMKN
jgi:hypothetical protein